MKKKVKSLLTLVLAFVMALAMNVAASASEETTPSYKITVKNTKTSVSIVDKEYKAYKIFDATYSGSGEDLKVAYTVNSNFENFSYPDPNDKTKSYKGEDLINYLQKQRSNTDVMNDFAEKALAYATTNHIGEAGSATGTGTTGTETATISVAAPGYYLVAGTAGAGNNQTVTAACSLTTAAPTAEVVVKADAPSVDKKIVSRNSTTSANTASIGDKVSYKITSTVPDMTGYEKYYFIMNDTLSKGLTYNGDVVVTIDGIDLIANTDYTVTAGDYSATDGTTLKIVFKNFVARKADAGKAIVVTYSATVNQNAVVGNTGNANDVTLTYSNNPNVIGQGENEPTDTEKDDVTGKTPTSTTKTYVAELKLTKVDGTNKTALTGAKFSITGSTKDLYVINSEVYKKDSSGKWYMLKDGRYTETPPTTGTEDQYDSTTQKYSKVTEVVTKNTAAESFQTEAYVNENGVLTIDGLGIGTYTITELVAPNGYNLLKNPIEVTVTANATATGCVWTATYKEKNSNETAKAATVTDGVISFNVENNSGSILPTTGGIGTTIFYVLGTVLVLGAGVLLITRKRMSKAE